MDRRRFLKTASGVITGVLAAGSPLAALAPSRAWAMELASLTSEEGATLMAMLRTVAPHDRLEDVAYAAVAKGIDNKAGQDEALRAMLKTGLARLNDGGSFAALGEERRVALLRAVESTPFFQSVRVDTLMMLYDTPQAAALFGYEGEVFSRGGYLYHGFNDLKWLPDPPLADSGPVPL
jgi:hypothetical protein